MNDEIKEILDNLKNIEDYLSFSETSKLLDYITNLQKENERLINENETIKNVRYMIDETIYKSRIDKAIEYNEHLIRDAKYHLNLGHLKKMKKILTGDDKE